MKKLTAVEIYDLLVDYEFFTNEELQLLTNINGLSVITLNEAIYTRYGYRDIEQLLNETIEMEILAWQD